MDQNLGYEKHDDSNKHTENRRNVHSKKTVRSEYGDITHEVPRDRDGEFEPMFVKKQQKSSAGIEEQLLSFMPKGSVRVKIRTIFSVCMVLKYRRL